MKTQANHHSFEIDPSYQQILDAQAVLLDAKRELLSLPPLSAEQAERLKSHLPASTERLVAFLFECCQGARTDTIASSCAIGNVSDAATSIRARVRDRLKSLGLAIHCQEIRGYNRFGHKTVIGTWFLTIVDPDLWGSAHLNSRILGNLPVTTTVTTETTHAANDSTF
jgi:hypothetical protein